MAKLSVIVPVYNVEEYLERCILSILRQSFTDFRLILVNDGSTDRSGEICDAYKQIDSRIMVIHQENQGLSMARNKGIELTTEEYISFIDSDDTVHKDMLKVLYYNLIKYQADISICNYRPVYEGEQLEDQREKNKIKLFNNIEAVNKIVEKNNTMMIIAWGKIYKSSLFKDIRYPKGKYHEDEFVTYKLLYNSKTAVVTSAKLYYYTQRKESITGDQYNLKRLEKLEGLKEAVDFFHQRGEESLEVKAKVRYLLNIQIAFYRVKYEIHEKHPVLRKLMRAYHRYYKELSRKHSHISIITRPKLKTFYIYPDLYCKLVKTYMNLIN